MRSSVESDDDGAGETELQSGVKKLLCTIG